MPFQIIMTVHHNLTSSGVLDISSNMEDETVSTNRPCSVTQNSLVSSTL